jgi:DNA-binding protein HU-beta
VTRAQLVARMADASGWSRAGADRALRAMLAGVQQALRRGEAVTLVGFGTFSVARRRPRTIRNPRTGHQSQVAGRVPRFKASARLRRAVP